MATTDESVEMSDVISYTMPVDGYINGLSRLYESETLCDAEIMVDGKLFRAHKLVLAALCPYFEAIYVGTFREASESKPLVLQQGVNSDGFAVVLKSLYTTILQLKPDNIVSVLTTAHFLQMRHIIVFCEKFMLHNMRPSNCLQYLKLAEVYSLDNKIIQAAEVCFVQNFETVSHDSDFLEMSKGAICKYLESPHINSKENEVLKAALRWLYYQEDRLSFAADVLGCVRLALFKTHDLVSEVLRLDFVRNSSECQAMVDEAIKYSANIYSQPLYTGKLNQARASETIVLFEECNRFPGRYETLDHGTDIHFCKFQDGKWDCWKERVDLPFAFYSAVPVVCQNFMYVHGVDGRYMGNVMLRYDGSTRNWVNLAPIPQQATVGYIAALVASRIILAGGLLIEKESTTTVSLHNITKRTFVYNIEKNVWDVVEMLPHKLAFGAGCSLRSKKHLLVTGGYTDIGGQTRKTNKVVAYDMSKDIWITKPPMRLARVQHSCTEFEGKVYVLGGGGTPEPEVTDTCEIYCPVSEQWTLLRSGFTIKGVHLAVYRTQLLGIVGKKPMIKYFPEKQRWKRTDFTSPCKVTVVSVLKVPKRVPHIDII